jgi:glycosyltransferase involved in cell wall biosynthesis
MDKVDLVMWTKNGAATLPFVLKKINEVIPSKLVNKRVIVDDHSSDSTREIAQSYNWDVVFNEGSGISDGANTAFKLIESEYFISFEQDLLLADDWWNKIIPHMSNPKNCVASGVRLPNQPSAVRKIEEYTLERYQRSKKGVQAFLYGKTLDNTIYRTNVIKELGGFPKLAISAGVDNVLAEEIRLKKLEWKVDFTVKSVHLRKGLRQELSHSYWYGTCFTVLDPILFKRNVDVKPFIIRFVLSPIRGLDIALKKAAPEAILVYPLMRLAVLRGVFSGMKNK